MLFSSTKESVEGCSLGDARMKEGERETRERESERGEGEGEGAFTATAVTASL